jgi:hypothetical protein
MDAADYMSARFSSRLNEMYSRVWRQMLLMSCMNPVCLVLFAAVMTGLGMYGMQELRAAHLTIAMLISYFTFAAVMVAAMSQVGYLGGRLRQAGAILVKHERMLAIREPHSVQALTPLREPIARLPIRRSDSKSRMSLLRIRGKMRRRYQMFLSECGREGHGDRG